MTSPSARCKRLVALAEASSRSSKKPFSAPRSQIHLTQVVRQLLKLELQHGESRGALFGELVGCGRQDLSPRKSLKRWKTWASAREVILSLTKSKSSSEKQAHRSQQPMQKAPPMSPRAVDTLARAPPGWSGGQASPCHLRLPFATLDVQSEAKPNSLRGALGAAFLVSREDLEMLPMGRLLLPASHLHHFPTTIQKKDFRTPAL